MTDNETSCVLEIPNSIHAAVTQVVPIIRRLRGLVEKTSDTDQDYELEVRFGSSQRTHAGAPRTFVPGINYTSMRQIENMLSSFDKWDAVSQGWVYTQDYFYLVDGKQYRTSVLYKTGAQPEVKPCAHVFKSVLSKLDLQSVPMHSTEILDKVKRSPLICDIRVGLSSEKKVSKDIPHLVNPHLLRFKQRRWFEYNGWRYDLTKAWQAKTREEMEKQQMHEPVCEFEIECCRAKDMICRPYHNDEYIATSLLLKALDFLTVQGVTPLS